MNLISKAGYRAALAIATLVFSKTLFVFKSIKQHALPLFAGVVLTFIMVTSADAQTQFWSDTFEDSGAPSAGTRTPSTNTGFPSVPYAYYFMRTDGTNLNLQGPFPGDPYTTYQNIQGSKFWAGEDTDRARTGVADANDKVQQIEWTGINISGKSGLSFKGLFAAHRNQAWQNPTFGPTYDFLIVEYKIDAGAWTRVGGFNGDASATNAGYLREDTNADNVGDGTYLSKTFQEFSWAIAGTGTTLSLRFRVSADASAAQEFAIDNFRLLNSGTSGGPSATAGNVEYFEGATANSQIFNNSATGLGFTLTNKFFIQNVAGYGVQSANPPTTPATGSNFYIDNFANQATNQVNSIKTTNKGLFAVKSLWAYPSSITDGGQPTNNGTLTFTGKKNGTTVYTFTKSGIFQASVNLGANYNGFTYIDFSVGTDNSNTLIDELEISLGSTYKYLAIDNFAFTATPSIVNAAASSVTSGTATINANVNPSALATSAISFDYSTSSTLASGVTNVVATPSALASANTATGVSANITGLLASTTYYYRAKATNTVGTNNNSAILSFTTSAPAGVLLSTSPTIHFANSTGFGDNIAEDGEGGSTAISDINIQTYPINSSAVKITGSPLTYYDNNSSGWTGYPGIISYGDASSFYGWVIKSSDGSNFSLASLNFLDWGDQTGKTFKIEAFDGGATKGSLSFVGNTTTAFKALSQTSGVPALLLPAAFGNVDEVRVYQADGGNSYIALNDVKVGTAVVVSNSAPIIAGASASQAVNDNSTVSPFTTITITDADASQTQTVSVTLDASAKGSFTTLNGFTNAGGGVYTFSGTAAASQTAIRGLVFTPTANRVAVGSTETTTFTISVNDGVAAAVTNNTTTVVSTSVNNAPIIAGTAASQAVNDNATISPFSAVTITDADSPAQSQTVSVTLDVAAKGSFTTLNGFTNPGGGVYTFSGTAAAAQTAIRGLVFTPTPNRVAPASTETTTFTISVNDGVASAVTNNATTVVSTSINDAPVGIADSYSLSQGATLTVTSPNVLTNDTDPDGSTLTAVLVTGPVNGSLTLNANGSFTYVHNGTNTTSDSFTYRASDGSLNSNATTVTLTINTVVSVSSINRVTAATTNTTAVDYTVTFSTSVTGVDASDFTLTNTGNVSGAIGTPTGSGTTWTVPVSSITGNGTMRLDFTGITGVIPNLAATYTSGQVYTFDRTAATLTSGSWSSNNANTSYANVGNTVTLAIGFNEGIQIPTIVIAGHTVTPVMGATNRNWTATYTLTAGDTEGNIPWTIDHTDLAGNIGTQLAHTQYGLVLPFDKTPPAITISAPSVAIATPGSNVSFTISYTDANFNNSTLSQSDITVNATGTASYTSLGVTGSGTNYTVTLNGVSGLGTLGISIAASTGRDMSGNIAGAAGPSATVTLASNNANLSALATSAIGLSPTFAQATVTYTASVPNATTTTSVTPTVADAGATVQVRINGGSYTTVTSGAPLAGLALNVGNNPIDITVTAQDGTTTKTYTITVARAAAPLISTSGTLTAMSTPYHTPSASQSFNVSGTTMLANVLVTAPSGFEVSSNNVNFSNTINIGSVGDFTALPVYVRLSATAPAGTYSGNISLTSASAVTKTVATISSTVSPKAITLTLNPSPAITKEYNALTGANLATGNYTLVGVDGLDAVTVSGTASYDTKTVGTGKTITANTFVLAGADAANYSLTTTTATTTGSITAKAITLALNAVPAITKTYNASTVASLVPSNYTLTGVIGLDAVTVSGTAAYDNMNIGTGKTVTANTFVLAGADAVNYSLTTTSATTTGAITAKTLTLALNAVPAITKTYDGLTTASLASGNYTLSGIVGAETVTVTGTASYDTKTVGTGKTVTANSFVLAGADAGNYSLTTTTATTTGAITAKTLTLALNAVPAITKTYNASTAASLASGNYSLTGIIGLDAVTVSGTAAYDNMNIGTGKTITANTFILAGSDAGNYSLTTTSATTTGAITAKTLTLALNAVPAITKAYDGLTTASLASGNYTLSGIVGAETVTVTGTASYDTKTVGTGKTITANSFVLAGADAGNYSLTTTTANTTGAITTKALTLALNAVPSITKIYNGSAVANLVSGNYTLTGIVGLDVVNVSGTATYDNANIGTGKTITANTFVLAGADAANYSLTTTSATTTGAITAKTLTLVLNAVPAITKTYDGLTTASLATGNYTLTGVVGGETVTVTGAANYDTKLIGTGKTISVNTFVLGGADAANYSLTTTSATTTGAITAKALTLTLNAAPAISKTYDGLTTANLATDNYNLIGIVGAETVTVTGTATYDTKAAGTGKVVTANNFVLAGADVGNYTLSTTTASTTGTILQKIITVIAVAKAKIYGAADPALTYTFAPALISGDNFTGGLTRTAGENVGNHSINQGTLALSGDYQIAFTSADLAISKRNITVSVGPVTKVYGTSDPVLVYGISESLPFGDTFTGNLVREPGENVGEYAINVGTLTLSPNYNLSYAIAKFTITPKPIVVSADAQSKTYGDADPELTYATGGLVNGDALTGALARTSGENVGNYTIAQGTLSGNTNYTISFNGNSLNIVKKPLVIKADDKLKGQGANNPQLTASYTGFITGETNAVLTAQPVLSTTALINSPKGTYPINVGGASAANYTITYQDGALTIAEGKISDITMTSSPVHEGIAVGTGIGQLRSVSENLSALFTYSLVAGAGSTDNAFFTISGNSVQVAGALDYETKANYNIRIRSTDQNGVTFEKTFAISLIDVNEAPTIAAIPNSAICFTTNDQIVNLTSITAGPETTQTPTLTVTSNNPAFFTSLSVTKGAGTLGTLNYKLAPGAVGTVQISITVNDNGGVNLGGVETTTQRFNLTINALPLVNINSDKGVAIFKGETALLTATGGTTYSWANANGIVSGQNTAILTIKPTETTTYTVTATNANGCSEVKTITITVTSLPTEAGASVKATNIMSPNGDGVNDTWVIENIELFPNNSVKIVDRSGRLVYSKKNYDNSWNATFSGLPLAEGTYYYIIDFGDGKTIKKGFITVLRK